MKPTLTCFRFRRICLPAIASGKARLLFSTFALALSCLGSTAVAAESPPAGTAERAIANFKAGQTVILEISHVSVASPLPDGKVPVTLHTYSKSKDRAGGTAVLLADPALAAKLTEAAGTSATRWTRHRDEWTATLRESFLLDKVEQNQLFVTMKPPSRIRPKE